VYARAVAVYCAIWLVGTGCSLHRDLPIAMSDVRPSSSGVRQPSYLLPGCRLERTAGEEWNRLWLNCGRGPHLLSEPSSLAWHVEVRTPEQALELVRLFTSYDGCERLPQAGWIEVVPGEKDGWLRLDAETFARVCPQASAIQVTDGAKKWFSVASCLMRPQGGDLYRVVHIVHQNGDTYTGTETVVLASASRRVGTCNPGAALE
jgi:hypothetical protein